ncbi:retrovirus-related pol polyprotein from transposon tnt 1-94 [Trifolium medium]|uniref:Retrovirus-related pol polyprotein from transposon tnt 1-94 n=1 Tax=Trifolium medium TaxID=97028 RepID=A0A392ME04_9FABA|nr:retrovirus-related pol polyprotein from transposon tnt 1-94 [Trifolium medium]
MKGQQESTEEQALKVSNGRGSGRGRGRSSNRGRGRGRQSKELVECYKCHKLAHYQSECPTWEGNAHYAEFNDDEDMLLMAKTEEQNFNKIETWFLDSGCSNHMVGHKEWLFEFDDSYKDSVKLGDDSKMDVKGKGNIKLSINNIVHVISNVYYVPGLKTNLLSIGQLQQRQISIIFKNDMCKVFHDDRGLLFTTHMSKNRMYVITAPMIIPMCLKTTKQESTQLWHDKYGHLSFKGLNTLSRKQMVNGLPELEEIEENCADCLSGKQHRDTVPKQANWRASMKLELIHSDICGPITPQSNGGNRYFMTLTDDYSRKTWSYILKEKSNAFEVLKNFKALVEKETGCSILCLRTDRGGEYTSNEFNEFCSNEGIKRQLTTAYTPQQNGVSERKNRIILNIVRSMINARRVPKTFWPEAVKWATYVMNRSPTFSVKDMTPEEAWSGSKPSVHHFRIFGCLAHVHIPDKQRKKLDNKSKRCVLLGVSDESKAYKLYDPVDKKIIISRDVVFEESK